MEVGSDRLIVRGELGSIVSQGTVSSMVKKILTPSTVFHRKAVCFANAASPIFELFSLMGFLFNLLRDLLAVGQPHDTQC